MNVKETKTLTRRARIDLPYDRVVEACKKIAREEGHDVADLDWTIAVPFLSDTRSVWLSLYETFEKDREIEIKTGSPALTLD